MHETPSPRHLRSGMPTTPPRRQARTQHARTHARTHIWHQRWHHTNGTRDGTPTRFTSCLDSHGSLHTPDSRPLPFAHRHARQRRASSRISRRSARPSCIAGSSISRTHRAMTSRFARRSPCVPCSCCPNEEGGRDGGGKRECVCERERKVGWWGWMGEERGHFPKGGGNKRKRQRVYHVAAAACSGGCRGPPGKRSVLQAWYGLLPGRSSPAMKQRNVPYTVTRPLYTSRPPSTACCCSHLQAAAQQVGRRWHGRPRRR